MSRKEAPYEAPYQAPYGPYLPISDERGHPGSVPLGYSYGSFNCVRDLLNQFVAFHSQVVHGLIETILAFRVFHQSLPDKFLRIDLNDFSLGIKTVFNCVICTLFFDECS